MVLFALDSNKCSYTPGKKKKKNLGTLLEFDKWHNTKVQ